MLFNDLSNNEFIKVANMHVEVLNHALRDLPEEKARVHMCWCNYEGPHTGDIGMDKMFDTLMKINAQSLVFETANARLGHEWRVFAVRKQDIPDNNVLMPGVIDTTLNVVEHPELVAERAKCLVNIVGSDLDVAGSDYGFGTFAGFGAVDPGITYAKLSVLAEGTAIVNNKINLTLRTITSI